MPRKLQAEEALAEAVLVIKVIWEIECQTRDTATVDEGRLE